MRNPANQPPAEIDASAVDKVLAALRNAEAPAGMEDRILRTLEARRPSRGSIFPLSFPKGIGVFSPSRSRLKSAPAYITASLALASLLIAVSFIQSTRRGVTPTPLQTVASPTAPRFPNASGGLDRQSPNHLPSRPIHGAKPASVSLAQPVSDEDALALSEMLAPSKPAPPLPLTRQEKMLAEVVHRGEPEEMNSLRPEVRARQMELSKTEFHDFFEPPPAKDNE